MENFYTVQLKINGIQQLPEWIEATDATAAIHAAILKQFDGVPKRISATVRRAVYGEFDCNNFTLAGHVEH